MVNIYDEIISMKNKNLAGVLVTVVNKEGQGPAVLGKKMIYRRDNTMCGTVGGGELEKNAIEECKDILMKRENRFRTYNLSVDKNVESSSDLNMICGGTVSLFFEYINSNPTIVILGAGHVGRALIDIASRFDYNIVAIDDRQSAIEKIDQDVNKICGNYEEVLQKIKINYNSYIVIAGYSHEVDYQTLKKVKELKVNVKYIGLMASPKKRDMLLELLKKELDEDVDLSNLHSPIGLKIGGNSPYEIALSILSEIQGIRYGKIN